ncbi:hypothetical protein Vqi01_34270 [Micromonospora qiuiae]|uniref:DUF6919 domain-containing protein n=1 Tax=Micromonospora qiuiae TaxID=502268 RepID=A0ABQ4JEA2_9ACTN|nr:hypothetical protein [Micromonospora qiuiae]GIJ28265.1 hypothetical protein Vqi01_34270 [Micromonospora qiuiae]
MTLTWATATTLTELGELTARWLTGDLDETPTYCGPPDEETATLVPVLAAINRAGFVTDFSQPGEPLDRGWQQRAALSGFVDAPTCNRLAAALAPTDLILLHEHDDSGIRIPVTLQYGAAHTWVGGFPGFEFWEDELGQAALHALDAAWYVTVVDPVWGRADHLWHVLAGALDLPHPEVSR